MQILVHEGQQVLRTTGLCFQRLCADNLVECEGVPEECELRTNSEFRRIDDCPGDDDANYGPTVGLEFLIVYNGWTFLNALLFLIWKTLNMNSSKNLPHKKA